MDTATARIVIQGNGDVEGVGVGVLELFLYFLLQSVSHHPFFHVFPAGQKPCD